MLIRPATPADADAVVEVIRAAFGDEGDAVAAIWPDLVDRDLVRASLVAAEADGAGGATDAGAVVGHVGLSHAWLDARSRLVDVLVLSPLSVLPGRQGDGIGTALLAAAVEHARQTGAPAVFLEGDPRYYGPRGFARASAHGCEAASRRTPDAAFQVVLLDAHEPWMTGRVVYRDVWWEHDAAGLRDPLLAQLEQALG